VRAETSTSLLVQPAYAHLRAESQAGTYAHLDAGGPGAPPTLADGQLDWAAEQTVARPVPALPLARLEAEEEAEEKAEDEDSGAAGAQPVRRSRSSSSSQQLNAHQAQAPVYDVTLAQQRAAASARREVSGARCPALRSDWLARARLVLLGSPPCIQRLGL
jgi:hypothetical protein